jgi:D-alanyl-D-alanine carboxypeptidase
MAPNRAGAMKRREFLYSLSVDQLVFPPDSEYRYSNTGYALLAAVLERVSGLRYDQFMAQNFFLPLGLERTRAPYLGTDQTVDSPFYVGYLTRNGVATDSTLDNLSENVGEGNIITTTHDLARWIRALLNGQTRLGPSAVEQMTQMRPTGDVNGSYGLGIAYDSTLGYGHAGAHVGYMTIAFYDPQADTNIVVMVNNLDADDVLGEVNLLNDIAAAVKAVLEGRSEPLPDEDVTGPLGPME